MLTALYSLPRRTVWRLMILAMLWFWTGLSLLVAHFAS